MDPSAPALLPAFTLVLLPALAASVAGWLWGPPLLRAWRRHRIGRAPFPQAWRDTLRHRLPAWRHWPPDVQARVKRLVQVLLAEKSFIGCQGLEVTDEMRVTVAAQAALLVLQRGPGAYDGLRQVLLYPGPFVVSRERAGAAGVVHDERQVLAGEAWQQGQVILSWPDVQAGAADPADGRNVVLHEFAHVLDHETGAANGAPWMPAARRRQWAAVLGGEFAQLQREIAEGQSTVLDGYAATNPAEFFAVATEAFFELPAQLAALKPRLYAELRQLFAVDPLLWPLARPVLRS